MKLAAIDTGSNAVRMAIGDFANDPQGVLSEVIRVPIRLGQEVFSRGFVDDSTAASLIKAFQKFRVKMQDHGVSDYKAVATSAMREARNGNELMKRVFQASQIQIQLIDGEEEARLVHLGIKKQMDEDKLDALIFDIGGGSVETIFSHKGKVTSLDSMRMGTVRLINKFDPDHDFDRLHTHIRQGIAKHHDKFNEPESIIPKKLVGTGGNVRCLGRMGKTHLDKATDQKLKLKDIEALISLLHAHTKQTRQDDLGLRPDRADVIMPAILIVYEFMIQYDYKTLHIPRSGLKNGVLQDLAGKRTKVKKK